MFWFIVSEWVVWDGIDDGSSMALSEFPPPEAGGACLALPKVLSSRAVGQEKLATTGIVDAVSWRRRR